jgi:hypothetical protein
METYCHTRAMHFSFHLLSTEIKKVHNEKYSFQFFSYTPPPLFPIIYANYAQWESLFWFWIYVPGIVIQRQGYLMQQKKLSKLFVNGMESSLYFFMVSS